VKVTEIGSSELSEEMRDELLTRDFTIYYFDENTIEACFKHRYKEVLNKYREIINVNYNFLSTTIKIPEI
jgi:hypothetical protein